MPIENEEDAKKYMDDICNHLNALRKISVSAGLHSHAAIWAAIHAAFLHSTEEIQTIVDMIGMYLKASEERYLNEL